MTPAPHRADAAVPVRRRRERLREWTGIDELVVLSASSGGRALLGIVGGIALLTIAGLALLWSPAPAPSGALADAEHLRATVVEVSDADCPGPGADGAETAQQCRTITVDPEGAPAPAEVLLGPSAGSPDLAVGDAVVVSPVPRLEGTPPEAQPAPYSYLGIDRSGGLAWAAVLLAVLALLALRWRGILAVTGVAASLLLLVQFLVPAMLEGHPPVLVALVGALAVMFVTLTLTNGVGAQTLASALGVTATLALTTALGLLAAQVLALDGAGGELSTILAEARPGLSLQGVLLAGMVIGALGVLADTAVTQASAVMSLRHTDPDMGAAALYRRAVRIGQDHLSATIHTLVLAYAGTALPLLLVLQASGASGFDTINQLDIVEPIVASLVGCAALIAAVPLTTGLAALLIARIPARLLPHGHAHAH